MNSKTVLALSSLYISLSILVFVGMIDLGYVLYTFIALSASFFALGQFASNASDVLLKAEDNKVDRKIIDKLIHFLANFTIPSSLSLSMILTYISNEYLPDKMEQISNGTTLFSLGILFLSIVAFEEN